MVRAHCYFIAMEIHFSLDQQTRLTELARSAGRSPDEIVQEAVALWEENQNARALAEFRMSLDRAETSLEDGGGRVITQRSMSDLAEEIHQRGLIKRAAGQKTAD